MKPLIDIILTGVGIYTGDFDELLDDEATITFDRSTTTINIWQSENLLVSQNQVVDTAMARRYAVSKDVIERHTMTVFLETPLGMTKGQSYDLEHNLIPTDVTNHFSGFPFTLMGADLWTCYGSKIEKQSKAPFQFSSVGERRRGRCCLEQGQIPYFQFWPLL